jgi:hypothetical protein
MNVALEQTEEYANGRLTGRFGECFLRGNNGTSLFCTPFTPAGGGGEEDGGKGMVNADVLVLYISALEDLD